MRTILAIAALCALLLGTAAVAAPDTHVAKALTEHYRLEHPAGGDPWPAVVLVSGCSGFEAGFSRPHYDEVQARLVALGFLTLRVNYLAVHEKPSCMGLPMEWVADDIAWVVAELRRDPRVKADAVNLLGWSWGGASALRTLTGNGERRPAPVAAVAAYYPPCQYALPWQAPVPVLVLHGTIDNVAPLAACRTFLDGLPAAADVQVLELADARHGFDVSQLPAEFKYAFGTLGSNPKAAAKAWDELTGFLRR